MQLFAFIAVIAELGELLGELLDETIIKDNETINEARRFFRFIHREFYNNYPYFIIILIIIILKFSIKCKKITMGDYEKAKWRPCDDVEPSDINNNGKVSNEEIINLMSKFSTVEAGTRLISYSYSKYILFRKKYG